MALGLAQKVGVLRPANLTVLDGLTYHTSK